ncbi:hypothetical protein B0H13DRAFT_1877440 [Mycena leptocephala]|nr:hypothetical protein B0H13DRAFT_1877440 [Mycena leptocephala]
MWWSLQLIGLRNSESRQRRSQRKCLAFPAGDVLVEKGNTGQDTFGIWEKIALEENLYAFKSRSTGFYIVAASDDHHLVAPPAEPPTVFAVSADNDTFIINEPDSGLVWEVVYTGDSNVGRIHWQTLYIRTNPAHFHQCAVFWIKGGTLPFSNVPCSVNRIFWKETRASAAVPTPFFLPPSSPAPQGIEKRIKMPHDAEARSKHSPADQEFLDGVSAITFDD